MRLSLNCLWLSYVSIGIGGAFAQDEPVSVLIERGNDMLARGLSNEALSIFSSAIEKDNQSYLTYFKRATTYLTMSRHSAALSDFEKVLQLKPDFTAAISQRGKVLAALGHWDIAAEALSKLDDPASRLLVNQISAARNSASAAEDMYRDGEHEHCVKHAGAAITIASASSSLRLLRAKCQVTKGDSDGAVGDLVAATRLNPADADIQILSANLFFFAQDDIERALQQIKACLHYDPDAKACKKTFRTLRTLKKSIEAVHKARDSRTWTTAKKMLKGTTEEPGLLAQLVEERDRLINDSTLSSKLHYQVIGNVKELACEVYAETKEPSGMTICDEALSSNPNSVRALRSKASILTREELFDDALKVLNQAIELDAQDQTTREQIQKTQRLLKVSKQKDYYKVLGVARDADTKSIKKKYRQLTKQFHPDKYRGELTKEQVVKKIEGINEAYEVLATPELRERFDRGDGMCITSTLQWIRVLTRIRPECSPRSAAQSIFTSRLRTTWRSIIFPAAGRRRRQPIRRFRRRFLQVQLLSASVRDIVGISSSPSARPAKHMKSNLYRIESMYESLDPLIKPSPSPILHDHKTSQEPGMCTCLTLN